MTQRVASEIQIDAWKKKLRRQAIGFEIGGFKPSADPFESWFGRVNVCAPGETWPDHDGEPMLALCQVNLTALPFRPPRLDDVDFITVFIGADDLPGDDPNGEGWRLRAYGQIDGLVPIDRPKYRSDVTAFPMRPSVIAEDYPCWEDVPSDIADELEAIGDEYADLFENVGGFKLGGWPTLIQSEIYWAPFNKHPASPEYVFQIDTTEKGNWMWGDNGVGYFGRGAAAGKTDEWAITWQCY